MRRLLLKLNNGFPIIELTIFLYILQYLVAPLFEYKFNEDNSMAVDEEFYFNYTLYPILAFITGLLFVRIRIKIQPSMINEKLYSTFGRYLIFLGVIAQLAYIFFPTPLNSAVQFYILFIPIGVFSLVFSTKKLDKLIIFIFSIQIIMKAILSAMLIDLIIFAIFLFIFYSLKNEISNRTKYLFFMMSFFFLLVFQGIKADYRKQVWDSDLSIQEKTLVLTSLITLESLENNFTQNPSENQSLMQTMHRLNQGWQTSKVFEHVPRNVEFENGKDFFNDIASAIMPRVFWPTKREVNDYTRFNHYTGYPLGSQTSMSIGVIGDFYINFGQIGLIIAMFMFGLFVAISIRFIIENLVVKNSIYLIFIPFIFSYLIRPGNEFYMVINHMFKASFILLLVYIYYNPLRLAKGFK
jgi:hypothetical protein